VPFLRKPGGARSVVPFLRKPGRGKLCRAHVCENRGGARSVVPNFHVVIYRENNGQCNRMIVAAIALLLAPQDGQKIKEPPKTLFQQYIKEPTGNSAFEDYLRAADALNTPEYLEMGRAINILQGYYPGETDIENKLPDWAKNKSSLDIERMRVAKFEPVLKWIEEGNRKPLAIPADCQDPLMPMQWLARYKTISKFSASAARVHLADDDPAGAARILSEDLKFAQKIRSANLISDLVGIACQSIDLAVIEVNLTNFGESDWSLLIDTADEFLRELPPLAAAYPKELTSYPAMIRTAIKEASEFDPSQQTDEFDPNDYSKVAPEIKKMSPDQREQLAKDTYAFVAQQINESVKALSLPEGKWPWPDQPQPTPPSPLIGAMSDASTPVMEQVFVAEARNRVQIRLFLLHGLIQSYRWRNNRLPRTLDELGEKNAILDQLAGGKFMYEIDGPAYHLFSRGRGDTQKIELRRRTSTSAGRGDPDQPDVP